MGTPNPPTHFVTLPPRQPTRRRRTQDGKGSHLPAAAPQSTCNSHADGSSSEALPLSVGSSDGGAPHGPPAPCAPPQDSPPSMLSPSAPSFTPSTLGSSASALPPPPPAPPLSLPLQLPPECSPPSAAPAPTRLLLPHAAPSCEEPRGLSRKADPSRSSQKRRAPSSSPDPPPPPAPFIVQCVVNERPAPSSSRPSRGRERESRSWDYKQGYFASVSRSRSGGREGERGE